MRPIDADAVLDRLPDDLPYKGSVKRVLMQAPTIDAVEVVRCRDCKHAREVRHRGEVMEGIYRCSYLKPNTDMFDIDYCRYGKRRETDGDG